MPRIHVTDEDNKSYAVFDIERDADALWGHNLQGLLPNIVTAVGDAVVKESQ